MSHLLVVGNPRKRRKAKAKTGARRKKRKGGMFGFGAKRNPRRVRRPAKARRRTRRFSIGAKRNPRRRVRRNPVGGSPTSYIASLASPAIYGAAGALGVAVAMGAIAPNLPASMQTGNSKLLVRAGVAIALGMVGEKLFGPDKARDMTIGALTIVGYQLVGPYLVQSFPAAQLSGRMNGQMNGQLNGQLNAAQPMRRYQRNQQRLGLSGTVGPAPGNWMSGGGVDRVLNSGMQG